MMSSNAISAIEQAMLPHLDNAQMRQLSYVLNNVLNRFEMKELSWVNHSPVEPDNYLLLERFLSAKALEGCSQKTIKYYRSTIRKMISTCNIGITRIKTDDLRSYLTQYEELHHCGKTNIDNIRRILSSFFSWLEDEDYILKSPIRRIKKIKSIRAVKEIYSDEVLERMRDGAQTVRDLAMIDLLASTGMRVGELSNLNVSDIDLERRECVVLGKGNKERLVYFDARTKIHLANYLKSRDDSNIALFVSLNSPHKRLEISGIESRLRKLGDTLGLAGVHPHKFRRTLATRAIDKGMSIEQVQKLLGHAKIDTTLTYAMVDQGNVRASHRRYIA